MKTIERTDNETKERLCVGQITGDRPWKINDGNCKDCYEDKVARMTGDLGCLPSKNTTRTKFATNPTNRTSAMRGPGGVISGKEYLETVLQNAEGVLNPSGVKNATNPTSEILAISTTIQLSTNPSVPLSYYILVATLCSGTPSLEKREGASSRLLPKNTTNPTNRANATNPTNGSRAVGTNPSVPLSYYILVGKLCSGTSASGGEGAEQPRGEVLKNATNPTNTNPSVAPKKIGAPPSLEKREVAEQPRHICSKFATNPTICKKQFLLLKNLVGFGNFGVLVALAPPLKLRRHAVDCAQGDRL